VWGWVILVCDWVALDKTWMLQVLPFQSEKQIQLSGGGEFEASILQYPPWSHSPHGKQFTSFPNWHITLAWPFWFIIVPCNDRIVQFEQ